VTDNKDHQHAISSKALPLDLWWHFFVFYLSIDHPPHVDIAHVLVVDDQPPLIASVGKVTPWR
jgi:hypothetical protein